MWPLAMYVCESWTLRKNEDFEMNGLRKILRGFVDSKENKWVGS